VTAYRYTPVGLAGPDPRRSQVVYGHDLEQVQRLQQRINELESQDAAARLEVALRRYDEEHSMRLILHRRLDRAAAALGALERAAPNLASLIEQARKDIWG
jgi:hypothetical protein